MIASCTFNDQVSRSDSSGSILRVIICANPRLTGRAGVANHCTKKPSAAGVTLESVAIIHVYLQAMELQYTLDNIRETARLFWHQVNGHKVFAFYGNMGAGKTTFINALCQEKQISSSFGSPTFSIINEYAYPAGTIFHIDLYRLKDEDEAVRAGVEDCLYSGHICLVEWPERAEGIFPDDTVRVHIRTIDPGTRTIAIV